MQHDFFNVVSTQRFREILEGFSPLDTETVVLDQACGRVSARDVLADQDIPLCDPRHHGWLRRARRRPLRQ